MRGIEPVALSDIQSHEEATGANVRLGGYQMPPAAEFETYRATLELGDAPKLFLLSDFGKHTKASTYRLMDVLLSASDNPRVAPFIRDGRDLRAIPDLAVLVISERRDGRPLIIYDGNHRIIAHWLMHGAVQDIPVFFCVHPAIIQWGHVPRLARS